MLGYLLYSTPMNILILFDQWFLKETIKIHLEKVKFF